MSMSRWPEKCYNSWTILLQDPTTDEHRSTFPANCCKYPRPLYGGVKKKPIAPSMISRLPQECRPSASPVAPAGEESGVVDPPWCDGGGRRPGGACRRGLATDVCDGERQYDKRTAADIFKAQ